MRRFLLGIAIASSALLPVSAQAGDQQIANHIEQKLHEAKSSGQLKDFELDLQVTDGVVWLKGHVATSEQEKFVLRTAQQAQSYGVVKIIDEISVNAVSQPQQMLAPVASQPIGTGANVQQAAAYNAARPQSVIQQTTNYAPAPAQAYQSVQQEYPAYQMPLAAGGPAARVAQIPNIVGNSAPAIQQPNFQAPNFTPVSSRRANAQYDHAQMPNYAWPSYAAHPNYGAVTYPKQYSPSAWPYIGPFYPYPQVPLGWRKVTMEWDDGWWQLDFHDQ